MGSPQPELQLGPAIDPQIVEVLAASVKAMSKRPMLMDEEVISPLFEHLGVFLLRVEERAL